ncbi:unnamed protein product [Polarella glacialis]|uniref:JmjC domain-containing protein n=4 Tax=Polarella glacialis TaxID=89957 RepID=A0A813HTQ4_POLGL|nr:unnamed protein product [Polarella glacialis]
MSGAAAGSRCAHCSRLDAAFSCSRCRCTRFCSPECQRLAWPAHKVHCGQTIQSTAQQGAEEWVKIVGTDAFPGADAGKFADVEAAKRECLRLGLGGFVTWGGAAFLRRQPAPELVAAARPAQGATLWLSVAQLTELSRARAALLPTQLPEVIVDGARLVQKCSGLSEDEMTDRFRKSVPVVLTDSQEGWPAREKWTFKWLSDNFGDEEMPCSDLAPFFKQSDRGKIRTVKASMREFVNYVQGQPSALRSLQTHDERVFYANGWAPFLEHPELLKDVSDRLYCVQDSIPRGDGPGKIFNASLTKVFLGPAGTVSRLHHDTYATHVWLSQIRGRKQFICYSPEDTENLHSHPLDEFDGRTSLFDPSAPDYEAFPLARRARAYSVVVEEGETVVLPARWWHWAKSLTPSVTLMRNFVNETNLRDHFEIRQRVEAERQTAPPRRKS